MSSEKDYGYLKTNSATATRIGTEIQHVPLSISVLSEDFVKDTGMRDIQDVLRYQASSSGDPRMGIRPPGNSATPSGNMKLRGFPISQRLEVVLAVGRADRVCHAGRVQMLLGDLAQQLVDVKRPVFGVAVQQRLVDHRGQYRQRCAGHGLGRPARASAAKHRHPRIGRALFVVEQPP